MGSTPIVPAEANTNPLWKSSKSFLASSDRKTCAGCRDVKIRKRGIYMRISDVQRYAVHRGVSTPAVTQQWR